MTPAPARALLLLAALLLRAQPASSGERTLAAPDVALPGAAAVVPLAAPEISAAAAQAQEPRAAPLVAPLSSPADGAASALDRPNDAAGAQPSSFDAVFDGVPFLPGFDADGPAAAGSRSLSFLKPNEKHPEEALPIFERALPGVYISVGTERGFISAAASGATHLLLADRNPSVAAYNRANAALLSLATDRQDYRRLRRATLGQAGDAAERRGWDSERVKRFLDDFRVFRGEQDGNPLDADDGKTFRGVNYLLDDVPFGRLKALADAGRIGAAAVDLKDGARVAALADALASAGLSLSVVDVSNAWWERYMGVDALNALAGALAKIAHPRSIVLTTDGTTTSWSYQGFLPYSRSAAGPLATADLSPALRPVGSRAEREALVRVGTRGSDGDFLSFYSPRPSEADVPVSYVVPNELRPRRARRILRRAPTGAYVAVGTERGFVGAALARSSHLLLVDRDPQVAAYNRFNAALLRLAKHQTDYARLREASFEDIEKRAGFSALEAADRETLKADFKAFSSHQLGNPIMTGKRGAFKGANYVRDPELFARVKALADGRRIKVVQAQLGAPKSDQGLADALLASGIPLAVLDVSNAWSKYYMGYGTTSALVRAFARAAAPDSIVMVTRNGSFGWSYYGFKPYGKARGLDEAADLAPALARLTSYAPNRLRSNPGRPWFLRRWLNAALNALR